MATYTFRKHPPKHRKNGKYLRIDKKQEQEVEEEEEEKEEN